MTCPLWNILESTRVSMIDMNEKYLQMVTFLMMHHMLFYHLCAGNYCHLAMTLLLKRIPYVMRSLAYVILMTKLNYIYKYYCQHYVNLVANYSRSIYQLEICIICHPISERKLKQHQKHLALQKVCSDNWIIYFEPSCLGLHNVPEQQDSEMAWMQDWRRHASW